MNVGDEKGIYCINAQAYVINNFNNNENSLDLFQTLVSENSGRVQKIDNWSSNTYTYPVCTQNAIYPLDDNIISLWTPSLLSSDVAKQYDLNSVYILFSVVPATTKQCVNVSIEKINNQEVTRYCNAWKHLVGKC